MVTVTTMPMLTILATAAFLLQEAVALHTIYCLVRNYPLARTIGVFMRVMPISPMDALRAQRKVITRSFNE